MNIQFVIDSLMTSLAKMEERLHPDARILPGFARMIQLKPYNCGAVSTEMVLQYFGKRISLESLERQLGTTIEGTSPSDIKRVLKKYGLKIHVNSKMSIRDLKTAIDAGSPVIVSLYDHFHYSVIYGYSSSNIFVMNPSLGEMGSIKCALSKSEFKDIFDHWGLIISR